MTFFKEKAEKKTSQLSFAFYQLLILFQYWANQINVYSDFLEKEVYF